MTGIFLKLSLEIYHHFGLFICTGYNDWSELSFKLVPNFDGVVWDFALSMFAYSDLQLEIRI